MIDYFGMNTILFCFVFAVLLICVTSFVAPFKHNAVKRSNVQGRVIKPFSLATNVNAHEKELEITSKSNTDVTSEEDELDGFDATKLDETEREMALEMYNSLRGSNDELSIEGFFAWDDIEDVLDNGVVDIETIAIILESCQVEDTMSFKTWLEVVDLVNQVQLTLENDGEIEEWDVVKEQAALDALIAEGGNETVDEESLKNMLKMLGLKQKDDQ